ncbi:MAG: type II toxin-antitoxin system PemK/MazF family toxin [Deltaproteobacteria bacterium]|nr:type II toxin-antitoxin system PemK/MazF family toxin [Deltaproteobacteria bacterium]
MNRGEIYRTHDRLAERGGKPGFYLVVSRPFIAQSPDVSTVVCAPVYSKILGISTEVLVGPEEGLPRLSAVRCDFLTLLFKSKLADLVGRMGPTRTLELDTALARALAIA